MLSVEDYILDAGAVRVLQFVFIHDFFVESSGVL